MRVTAIRSIRAFCVDCIGGAAYVEDCPSILCQLYPFRMGKNPNISTKTKEQSRERMNERIRQEKVRHKIIKERLKFERDLPT